MPKVPKIYHILHIDRLASVVNDGYLWSDSIMATRANSGTVIGMSRIKQRRLNELRIACYGSLFVGECVPFYFCPRSVMLFLLHQGNHQELRYDGGQEPIIHLESDLDATVAWAEDNNRRWCFTLSNAAAYYTEFRNDLQQLNELNWGAIVSRDWRTNQEAKQAEFLIEKSFPWNLVSRIGVYSSKEKEQIEKILFNLAYKPAVDIIRQWYY